MVHVLRALGVTGAVLIFCLALSSTGCGKSDGKTTKEADSKVTTANLDKLKNNMTEKEVTDILGSPTSTKDIDGGKEMKWESGSNNIVVGFKAGKVEYMMGAIVTIK